MNKTIQGMRAIAMLAIFLFHAGLLPNGYFPVTFFFMVSGFGIYTAKHALPAEKLSWQANGRWQRAKMGYFYALHLLLFAASIPIRWEEYAVTPGLPIRAALNLTLTQSWYPWYSNGFNNLSWFLSTLVFVYPAAFWAVRRVRSWEHPGRAAVLLLALEGVLNFAYAKDALPFFFEPYFNPAYRVLDLMLGMLAARWLLEDRPRFSGTGWELLVLALLGVQYVLYLPCRENLPAVFAPIFFAAICVFGRQKGALSRILQATPFQWLARWGFEFYMVQELLIILLRRVSGQLGLPWRLRVLVFTGGGFVLSLAFAMACQKWLKPIFNKGRGSCGKVKSN